ncbi:DEAD/DEAH box helicase family protein [Erythrobacter aureus]|uniref:Type III restriction endonuclease subunit R n=1 Tax=Erythrobacter aureus TaxID=2182384 RepID=A0A345YAT6_9SPHN|nr:DEAD/DEAH box helicase family protein [Erythrobacter aureus]AXK41038.1 type III restriction endonuclease subunit R [Erythrobacter aureus]
MKFTLKDYQEEAVGDVLDRLDEAREDWHGKRKRISAFSLTATTGAGKTVMAAAVFEALFYGNDDHEFEADPGAVLIWFSDDPSLNEQSKWRLHQASDKLTVSDLVTVENTFSREKFEPGKVYFLNTQKLGKKSLLVRGHDPDDEGLERTATGERLMPDLRSHTIWDTIQNTIEDPDLTLYLVLDEAHRGMRDGGNTGERGRPTIVKQLINGTGTVPGIPIVWGISATVKRFNDAMQGMQDRIKLPDVVVDSQKVQDSGLIKDTIKLDVPDEVGDFATVLLRRGTERLRDMTKAWADYSADQAQGETVQPLMVIQVPNNPDPNEIGRWLDTIFETWPDLPHDCVANVLGEHRKEQFGSYSVPYVEPERVQERDDIRILIAKDAISTGWDCPRAEVMVSFRAASDRTHITQLLGRMVRSPLARRVPGNDQLNAVDCLLPKFDKVAVEAVANAIMTGSDAEGDTPLKRVLIQPVVLLPNPAMPQALWDKFVSLPSQSLPKKSARPVKRLTALAHELAHDGLLPDAGKKAHAAMHKVMDGLQADLAAEIVKARKNVLTVEGKTLTADIVTGGTSFDDFVEAADYAVIEDAYLRAGRIISPDLATSYSEHLAKQNEAPDDEEEALIDAHTDIAALGLIDAVKVRLEQAAEALANDWLSEHQAAIAKLSDKRRDAYREISELSAKPFDVKLEMPRSRLQPTKVLENGMETDLPTYGEHLLCDECGQFPDVMNEWEIKVQSIEMAQDGRIGWYRNPPRTAPESLGIIYDYAGNTEIMRPDFLFFSKNGDGEILADIVDPHGEHFAESLPKLRGLADYTEKHGAHYRRIEAVARLDGTYRVLNLKSSDVREMVRQMTSAKQAYLDALSAVYG